MNLRRSLFAMLLSLGASFASAQAPAVQLDVIAPPGSTPEPQPTVTPTPTPEVIPLGAVELQTVEIVRKKSFTAPAAEADPTSLTTLDAEQIRRQLLQTGMSFEFRVTPPKGWDLIAVETASLVSLTDSAGAPLGRVTVQSDGASSNIDSLSAASTSELDSEFASVQLRTIPPPRGESLLRTLKASFKLQIGLRNTIHIHDLRNKLNQELLPGAAARGLGVQVTEIEKDRVTVAATGAIDEIGNLELVDLDKAALKDIGREQNTIRENGVERHLFTFYFKELPQFIGMNIDIYPRVETQTLEKQWENIELP